MVARECNYSILFDVFFIHKTVLRITAISVRLSIAEIFHETTKDDSVMKTTSMLHDKFLSGYFAATNFSCCSSREAASGPEMIFFSFKKRNHFKLHGKNCQTLLQFVDQFERLQVPSSILAVVYTVRLIWRSAPVRATRRIT